MGGCCFTPTKKDFLWWYWLLLASIVGIPMLLAVLYVGNTKDLDEETKKRRGKTAAWIFWIGTFVVGIAAFKLVKIVLLSLYPSDTDGYFWSGYNYYSGYAFLAVQFFFATVAANGANNLIRKRKDWFVRIVLLLSCLAMYLIVILFTFFTFLRPAINVMQFLVCMLPAHYWGNFKDAPDTPRAWKALAAFVASALLFFIVSYFGEDFAQLLCGPIHR